MIVPFRPSMKAPDFQHAVVVDSGLEAVTLHAIGLNLLELPHDFR
jgi:hypothetical protein